ncbi:MAG: hypothetical protein K6E75_09935 [Lachnospiraceae bacterium]|nr:hypothetical protein [Lachnospiraceae bacterium]
MNIIRYDAEAYLKIAQKLSSIDTAEFDRFSDELTRYIQSNERNNNEEIRKKVTAARTLLTLVGENGKLRKLKEDMGVVAQRLQEKLEDPELKRIEMEDFEEFSAFDRLSEMIDPPEGTPGIDKALTDFLESDNFSAYRSNSSLKNLSGAVTACKFARESHKIIESRYEIDKFQRQPNGELFQYTEEKDSFNARIEPLHLVYHGTLSLADIDQKILEQNSEIDRINNRLEQAYVEFFKEKQQRENVRKEVERLESELKIVVRDGNAEINRVNSEQAQRDNEQRKSDTAKAFDMMQEFHHDLRLKAGEDWLTVRANEAKRKVEQLRVKKTELDAQFDPDIIAEKLSANKGEHKEAAKGNLLDLFYCRVKSKEEEKNWLYAGSQLKALLFSQKGNEDAMKMLFAKNENEFVEYYENYLARDPEMAKEIHELTYGIRHNCPDKSIFQMDETDLDQKIATLQSRIKQRQKASMQERYDNELYDAVTKYDRLEKKILQAQEDSRNLDINSTAFSNLQKELNNMVIERKEKMQILENYGLSIEEVKEMIALSDKYINGEIHAMEYEKTRKQYQDAVQYDTLCREKLAKAKWCYDILKDQPAFKEDKKNEVLVKHLFAEQKDESRIETDQNFARSKQEAIEQIDKDYRKKAEGYVVKCRELKEQIEAKKEYLKQGSRTTADYLADTLKEKDDALERLDNLKKKKAVITGIHQAYYGEGKLHEKAMKAKQAYDRLDPNAGEKAYRSLYEQIEAFRRDYLKDWKDSYRNNPDKNSTFYKAIKTALDAFGTYEELKKMSEEQIREKVRDLNGAATTYTAEKLSQRGHWLPSSQRRYRLDYAARITNFCAKETEMILENMKEKDYPFWNKSAKRHMKELSDEKFDQLDQNGLTGYMSRDSVTRQQDKEVIDLLKQQIETKVQGCVWELKEKGPYLTEDDMIWGAFTVALGDKLKDTLNDYAHVKALYDKNGMTSIKKWVKDRLDNLQQDAADKKSELLKDDVYKNYFKEQAAILKNKTQTKNLDVHDFRKLFDRSFFTANGIAKNKEELQKKYSEWSKAQKKAEPKKEEPKKNAQPGANQEAKGPAKKP